MRTLILLVFLYTSSCYSSGDNERMSISKASEDYATPVANQRAVSKAQAPAGEEITKKVVKTGGIEFESEDVEEDSKEIQNLLPKFEAYIESENQYKSDDRISYNLTIRVPSSVYDSLLNTLSNRAYRLENKHSNAEDVTDRYYDLSTRIKNKEALEERYLDILSKASKITDILEIERNLNEVRTEIENLQGQFNYLSKRVSLSTINVSFYETLPFVYDSSNRTGFGARVLSGLDNGWQGFLTFLVGVATLWPFVLILAGGIFLFRKLRARWRKRD